jgi:hypothetical protein
MKLSVTFWLLRRCYAAASGLRSLPLQSCDGTVSGRDTTTPNLYSRDAISRWPFYASVAVLGCECIACFFSGYLEWGTGEPWPY